MDRGILTLTTGLVGLAVILSAGSAGAVESRERNAKGSKPADTQRVLQYMKQTVGQSHVPQRFKRYFGVAVKRATLVKPGASDRCEAIKSGASTGDDQEWASLTMSGPGRRAGQKTSEHISVTGTAGHYTPSLLITRESRRPNGRAVKAELEVTPLKSGNFLEEASHSLSRYGGSAESFLGGTSKYFLLDGRGNRMVELTQNQELILAARLRPDSLGQQAVAGQQLTLARDSKSYFWDMGFRTEQVTAESAELLKRTGSSIVVKNQPSFYLATKAGAVLTPISAEQASTLAYRGMKLQAGR